MKLIEFDQEYLIVCDNKKCDYKVKNLTKDINVDTSDYINKPCPKCGENLLTEEDYRTYKIFVSIVNFVNKWFGWIGYFYKDYPKERPEATVKIHKGIKIKKYK